MLLVAIISANIWMFCSKCNDWVRIVSALFLNVELFIICPATLVWLNENSRQYLVSKLRQNITRRICYRQRNRGTTRSTAPKLDGNNDLTEVAGDNGLDLAPQKNQKTKDLL